MAANNIEKAIVSCSSPGTNLYADDVAANILLTEQFNNFTADLKRQHPDKFGFFASLPLTDIDASLAEVDRAMDELDADGFVLLSNYFGLYHGDPKLRPVYDKINARGAVLFIHPTAPCPVNAPTNVSGTARLNWVAPLMNDYGLPTLEFLFDTTRTLSDIVLTGTAEIHSNIKWIIPHCGSVLPAVLERFVALSVINGNKAQTTRDLRHYSLSNATELLQKQFWFDLAGWSMSSQIFSMHKLFGADKFLYGSDTVFTSPAGALALTARMNETLPTVFSDDEIASIFNGNAKKLLRMN